MQIFDLYKDVSTNKYWVNVGIPMRILNLDIFDIVKGKKTIEDVCSYYSDRIFLVPLEYSTTDSIVVEFKEKDLVTFKPLGKADFLLTSIDKTSLYSYLIAVVDMKKGQCFELNGQDYMFLSYAGNEKVLDYCDDFLDFMELSYLYAYCINRNTEEIEKIEILLSHMEDVTFYDYELSEKEKEFYLLKHQLVNNISTKQLGSKELLTKFFTDMSLSVKESPIESHPVLMFRNFVIVIYQQFFNGKYNVHRYEKIKDNDYCEILPPKLMTYDSLKMFSIINTKVGRNNG